MIDQFSTLWGGWLIEDKISKKIIYFVGDTGYAGIFKELRENFILNVDLALIPIGQYEPKWFMNISHVFLFYLS